MTAPTQDDYVQNLLRDLESRNKKINSLLFNIRQLESDVFLSEREDYRLHMCIDFFDLQRYLSSDLEDVDDLSLSTDRYVRIMLFTRYDRPVVLLPSYYLELRDHFGRFFRTKSESVFQRRNWSNLVVDKINSASIAAEGFFHYLNWLSSNKDSVEFDEVGRLAREVLCDVRKSILAMRDVIRAGGMLKRFDALVKRHSIIGLSEAVLGEETITIEKGDLFLFAKNFLDKRRRGKTIANETDALAISSINQLNGRFLPEKHLFCLVSGAPMMAEVVRQLNEKVLRSRKEVFEFRDLDYWKLWFATIRRQKGSDSISLGNVRQLRDEIGSELEELSWRNGSLSDQLRSVAMKGDDENSRILLNRLDLFGKIKNYIEDFDRLFAEIESPFSDVDKTLSMLGDILLPLEDERLSAVVGRINALLEELSEDFSSIEQLRSLILQLRQELEELVWIIKGESFEGMRTLIDDGSRDLEFRGGWSVEDSEWPQPYKRLIVKIEEAQGKEGLREVFRRLSDLTEKHPLSFERYVISARAHLKEGLYTEAEKELACVKPENRSDAEYLLTVALMHEAKSELLQAETLLRDLERRHDSRMIRLRLAWVLWRRFKEEGNSSRLAEALANAKLAKRGVSDESLGLQIQTAFIYYQIVTEEGCDDLNAQNIEEGTTEVRRLLELAGRDNRLQHYRPTLEKLLDRLSDSLNMDVD